MGINKFRVSLAITAAVFLQAGFASVHAAPAPSTTPEVQEDADDAIIVTAQKRSERLVDVPMSITAINGSQLIKAGVVEISQLVQAVPGLNYQQGAFGTPILSIRGIGYSDNSVAAGPAVTAYVDQVALPYSVMTRGAMLDLERVEVLKGPQGTLFGMNSTGGAVNFIAARPTSDLSAGFDASFARFNEFNLSGHVSGALGETVSARLALQYQSSSGWQRSATRPGDKLGKKNFVNGRILLDWAPSEGLKFQLALNAWHDGSESQAAQFVQFSPAVPVTPITQYIATAMTASPVAGSNARSADWDPGRSYKRDDDFYQASLRADWELGDKFTLTSITAYTDYRGNQPIDIDGSAFTAFAVASHPAKLTSFAQELRIAGSTDAFDWIIGGNYQDEVANESTVTFNQGTNNQIGPFLFTALGQTADQDIKTSSVFGNVDFHLTSKLTLQAAARYTSQKRSFSGCIRDAGIGPAGVSAAQAFGFLATIFSGTPTTIPAGGCVTLDATTLTPGLVYSKLNEDNVSWRAGLDYKLSTDALIYANITKGYKSGSFGLVPGILSSQFMPVTQEAVLAYETGARVEAIRGGLNLNFAAFYNDYSDKQLKGIVVAPIFGPLPQLINIPKSRIYGFEFNFESRPLDGLRLNGSATYVASRVQVDPVAPSQPRTPFGALTSYVGEQFPNTPKWQLNSDIEYKVPIGGRGLKVLLGAALTYRSKSPAAFGKDPLFVLPSHTLIDLRAGVESANGKWNAQIWGRNITDKYYWNNVTHLTDYVSKIAGMPATFGLSIGYRY